VGQAVGPSTTGRGTAKGKNAGGEKVPVRVVESQKSHLTGTSAIRGRGVRLGMRHKKKSSGKKKSIIQNIALEINKVATSSSNKEKKNGREKK